MTGLMILIGQWVMLVGMVSFAVLAAGLLGWMIGRTRDEDSNARSDADQPPSGGPADSEAAATKPKKSSERSARKQRKGRKSALIATPTFAPVSTPTASTDEVEVPEGVEWSPPALPEEYAATVINVAPINAGLAGEPAGPGHTRPDEMVTDAGYLNVMAETSVRGVPVSAHSSASPAPASPPTGNSTGPHRAARATLDVDQMTPEELRDQLSRAEIELGRLEAQAVAAWDRTVPVLEDRIEQLQQNNSQLAAQVSELQGILNSQRVPRGRQAGGERDPRLSSVANGRS